jgi:hypothetical protein
MLKIGNSIDDRHKLGLPGCDWRKAGDARSRYQ